VRGTDDAGEDVTAVHPDLDQQLGVVVGRCGEPRATCGLRHRLGSWGQPLTRMSLPPSSSMSLARNATPSSSAARLRDAHDVVERGGDRLGAAVGHERSTPLNFTNATVATGARNRSARG